MTSIFGMLGVDLTAPDHTTLSRRGQHLALALRRARPGTSLHLIVDSTGLSIVGEGEWAAAKHGGRGRRGWRKLHLGVDGSRVIVACALTEPTADDAITGISLVDEVDGHLTRVTADPAYDTLAFYGAAGARGARVVVPPTKTASLSRRGARSGARDRTIRRVKALGRRRWKKASGDHQHARVENAFFRYKSIVGDCLRARTVECGDSLPEHGRRRAFPRLPLIDDGLPRCAHQRGQLPLAQSARATKRANLRVVVAWNAGPSQWRTTVHRLHRSAIIGAAKLRAGRVRCTRAEPAKGGPGVIGHRQPAVPRR